MKVCRPLMDYLRFVYFVRRGQQNGLGIGDAVDAAVKRAVEEGLLDGYFKRYRAEVLGMILSEYNEKEVHQIWLEDRIQIGVARGEARGLAEGEQRTADLFSALIGQGRLDDLARAANGVAFRSELMKELLG